MSTLVNYNIKEAAKILNISQKAFKANENEFLAYMHGKVLRADAEGLAVRMFKERFNFVTYIHY